MEACRCSCMVAALLCMVARAPADLGTVSQNPASITLTRLNLSAEITCSTSLTDLMGLGLQTHFHSRGQLIFFSIQERLIRKNTTAGEFVGRIDVRSELQRGRDYVVTLRLSLLSLDDTGVYFCSWKRLNVDTKHLETFASNGTVVIVQAGCTGHTLDGAHLVLIVGGFSLLLLLFIGLLVFRCTRFKYFGCDRAERRSGPQRVQQVYPQHKGHRPQYPLPSGAPLAFRRVVETPSEA